MREITLSVMYHNDQATDLLSSLLDHFENQNHIKVNLKTLTWNEAWSELIKMVLYHDGPDVSEIGNTWVNDFARMAGTPYGLRRSVLDSPLGTPCTPPPWGWLASVDMREGKINWQRKVGSIQDVAPAIAPNLELGMGGLGGPIVTAGGLIFMAAVMDDYLRAFDLESGETLWEARLPAGGQATPMTYYLDETGKQYVVIAAGGHARVGTTSGDYVIAYALPD